MHVGDIMSTVGVFSTMEENLLLFEYPMVLNISHSTHDIPYMYHDIPKVLKLQRMVSPTVLNTPTVLMISLHVYHYIPLGTEDPHGTQDNPHGTHDIPHGTEHPMVLKISPTFII